MFNIKNIEYIQNKLVTSCHKGVKEETKFHHSNSSCFICPPESYRFKMYLTGWNFPNPTLKILNNKWGFFRLTDSNFYFGGNQCIYIICVSLAFITIKQRNLSQNHFLESRKLRQLFFFFPPQWKSYWKQLLRNSTMNMPSKYNKLKKSHTSIFLTYVVYKSRLHSGLGTRER